MKFNLKTTPLIFLFRKMWQYSEGNRKQVVAFFAMFTVANTVWLIEPLLVAFIFNTIQKIGINEASLPSLTFYLFLVVVLNIVAWGFHGPARLMEKTNSFWVKKNYKEFLLKGAMDLPLKWHSDHHSGDTIDKIEKGASALNEFSETSFMFIQEALRFLISLGVLAFFYFYAGLLVVVVVVIAFILVISFDKIIIRNLNSLYAAENDISAKIYDVISNITTIVILRIEKMVSSAIVKKMVSPFQLFTKNSRLNETKWFLVTILGSFAEFLIVASYIFLNIKSGKEVLIGTVYLLYSYASKVGDSFQNFAWMYGQLVEYRAKIMNSEELARDFEKKEEASQYHLSDNWREIKIKNLIFTYQEESGPNLYLDDISFEIRKGEKVAFIGDSGSGKTTTLKILRGLYAPKQAKILVDGKQIPRAFYSLSSAISLIPQEPEIFATTIKENITFGIPQKLEYIKIFTNMARFTEVADRLPKKFNSSIVEKGVNLSGGEKQRLALSRGLLASVDKEIVLLDEPTSSVDSKNERLIYENIFRAFRAKAIIASVHRLHLLPLFDMIYFFKEGKIIAQGSFKSLLQTSPEFKTLWEKYNKTHKVKL